MFFLMLYVYALAIIGAVTVARIAVRSLYVIVVRNERRWRYERYVYAYRENEKRNGYANCYKYQFA